MPPNAIPTQGGVRQEHPHLKVIVVEDGLSSNGPHICDLQRHNLRFILGAKPGDHVALFTQLKQAAKDGTATDIHFLDPNDRKIMHFFRFMNQVPLNKSNPEKGKEIGEICHQ